MRRFLSLLLFVTFSVSLMAQNGKNVTVKWLKDNYTKREVMIPMRDGVRLYTAVYEPVSAVDAKPVMLVRTPSNLTDLRRGRNLCQANRHIHPASGMTCSTTPRMAMLLSCRTSVAPS